MTLELLAVVVRVVGTAVAAELGVDRVAVEPVAAAAAEPLAAVAVESFSSSFL
jgi:hypothetical protein